MFTKEKRLKSRSVSPLCRDSDRFKMNEKALKLSYSLHFKKLLTEQDQRTSATTTTTTLPDITSIKLSAKEDDIVPSTSAQSSTKIDENNFKKYFKITQNITNDKNLSNTKRNNHPQHIKRAIVDPQQVVLQRRLGEGVKPLFDRDDVKVNKNCANKNSNNKRDNSSSSSDSTSEDNSKEVITNRRKSLTPKRDWKYDKSPSKTKQVSSTSHKTTHKSRSRSREKQLSRHYRSNRKDYSTRKRYSRSRSKSPPPRKPYYAHNNRYNTNKKVINRKVESPKLSYYVDDIREEDRLRQKYGIDKRRDNKTKDYRNVSGSRRSRTRSPRDSRKRKRSSSRKRGRSQSSDDVEESSSRKQTVPVPPPHPYVPPMAVYPPPYGYAPYVPVDPMWMSAPPRQYIPRPPFMAPHYIGPPLPPPPPHMFRPRMPFYRPNYNRFHPRNR